MKQTNRAVVVVRKPKFRAGQVVMVKGYPPYPAKLVRQTFIGNAETGIRWFDTLGHVEYEARVRPLTRRGSRHLVEEWL